MLSAHEGEYWVAGVDIGISGMLLLWKLHVLDAWQRYKGI